MIRSLKFGAVAFTISLVASVLMEHALDIARFLVDGPTDPPAPAVPPVLAGAGAAEPFEAEPPC